MPVFKSQSDSISENAYRIAVAGISELTDASEELTRITDITKSLQIVIDFDDVVKRTRAAILLVEEDEVQDRLNSQLDQILTPLDSTFVKIQNDIIFQVNKIYQAILIMAVTLVNYDMNLRKLDVYQQAVKLTIFSDSAPSVDRWKVAFAALEVKKGLIP